MGLAKCYKNKIINFKLNGVYLFIVYVFKYVNANCQYETVIVFLSRQMHAS